MGGTVGQYRVCDGSARHACLAPATVDRSGGALDARDGAITDVEQIRS
jgi:hypothetical protein